MHFIYLKKKKKKKKPSGKVIFFFSKYAFDMLIYFFHVFTNIPYSVFTATFCHQTCLFSIGPLKSVARPLTRYDYLVFLSQSAKDFQLPGKMNKPQTNQRAAFPLLLQLENGLQIV